MSILLPQDNVAPGPVTGSPVHDLPFMPAGTMQAVPIFNALVRLLDSKLLDKNGGSATSLTVQDLAVLTSLTAPSATIPAITASTADISGAVVAGSVQAGSFTGDAANIKAVSSEHVETLMLQVRQAVERLEIINAVATTLRGDSLLYQVAEIHNLATTLLSSTRVTSTNGVFQNLEVDNLTAKNITTASRYQVVSQVLEYKETAGASLWTPIGAPSFTLAIPYFAKRVNVRALVETSYEITAVAASSSMLLDAYWAFGIDPAGLSTTTGDKHKLLFTGYDIHSVSGWIGALGVNPTVGSGMTEPMVTIGGTAYPLIKTTRVVSETPENLNVSNLNIGLGILGTDTKFLGAVGTDRITGIKITLSIDIVG